MTEWAFILWTGVVVGLIGLGATASNGVALMLRWLRQRTATAGRWVIGQLARFIPPLRRSATIQAESAWTTATGSGTLTGFGTMTPPENASIEVQLDAIRSDVAGLRRQFDYLEKQSRSRHSALESQTAEVRDRVSAVEGRFETAVNDTARTDARGLGPVAFGFIMVAVPHQLAYFRWLGVSVAAAATLVTGATVLYFLPSMLRASNL